MKKCAILFLVLLTGLLVGSPRIKLPRRRNIEGIEDPEAARAYDRISRLPQFRALRQLMIRELGKYGPQGTLVDIGCGPAYLLAVIAQAFPQLHLIGIDLSREMVDRAAENLFLRGMGQRVQFRTGDVQQLPLETGSVDFAVSSFSLHHWLDPQSAFQDIYRVLKPGGQMLVFDLRRDVRRWFYWLFRLVTALVVPKHLRYIDEPMGSLLSAYTRAELRDLLSTTRFAEWTISSGPVWQFIWAYKDLEPVTPNEQAQP